jgi:two-component system OmpR family sensor kinase
VSRSLQRQLSITLAWVIVVSGLAAAAVSLVFGYHEVQEFQDDTLRQIAALAPQGDPSAAGDNESRIIVLRLPTQDRPLWMPEGLAPGFHILYQGSERLRVYVRTLPSGERLVVAQPTAVRDELALNSAVRTLLPLLLLLPLLAWLTARIVANAVAPVRRLARDLDRQSPARLEKLSHREVPEEIAPFVGAINRLLDRVNGLLDAQRRFVADAAHELRTPLAALSLQAQNVEGAESLERARERMAPLRSGIERVRRLSEQLLTLAKTQASAAEDAEIDVPRLVRESIEEFLPAAQAKGIDLGMEEGDMPPIRGASEALRMIMGNALHNALRHTPRGGAVTVRLRGDDGSAVVEVVDTGPGIAPADRERAFDPFHRLERAPEGGSGLGLAIARDAALRLGGEASLHDGPQGRGLVFRFRQRPPPTGDE